MFVIYPRKKEKKNWQEIGSRVAIGGGKRARLLFEGNVYPLGG